ncbi:MAG: DegT/DnrJ/EryC1/StrS aminotransferase family protein [Marmoricola sp.]
MQPAPGGYGLPDVPESTILASGWRTSGPEVESFEREFAAWVGVDEAVAVSSGTVAVELALRALRLRLGARVLVSTLAPSGVLQAVVRAGLRPALLDVAEDTGIPTPDHVHAATRALKGPALAMVASHWGGNPCDAKVLAEAAGLPAWAIVEDAGQALGARLDGHPPGSLGVACFSFYSTANLPIGEGGMLTTVDADRARWLRRERETGSSPAVRHHVLSGHAPPHMLRQGGLRDGLTDQSAATGRRLLARVDAWLQRRQEIARLYDERLVDVPGLDLPHRSAARAGAHGWHQYPVLVNGRRSRRDSVVRALGAAGHAMQAPIEPLHRRGYAREVCDLPSSDLAAADRFADRLVCLPIHPSLPDATVDRVGEVLRAALRG